MNKLIKTCIVGGIVYVISDAACSIGKGFMLGSMAKTNTTGSQVIDMLSDDKRLRVKFVKKIAELSRES